jgi:hypothetical protein
MNRSLSNRFLCFLKTFFDPKIFINQVFLASAPLRPKQRGQRPKMRRDGYIGLAARTPIRTHLLRRHIKLPTDSKPYSLARNTKRFAFFGPGSC